MVRGASTRASGDEGEQIAQQFLAARGFQILEMNYRYGKGEIDIVCMDGDVLVFCEVKMRKTDQYGDPEYAITLRKQAQVRKIAAAYLYEHDIEDQECRFDVVAIKRIGGIQEVNYIPNAF